MEQLFKNSQEIHPEFGAYIHLCIVLNGSNASKNEVTKLFNKLMPIDEYDKEDKNELIDYLYKISLEPRYME